MTRSAIIVLALAIFGGIEAVPTDLTTPVPTAVHQPQDPAATFVPHQTYPYADTYGGYLYPVAYQPQNDGYMNALVPAAQVIKKNGECAGIVGFINIKLRDY